MKKVISGRIYQRANKKIPAATIQETIVALTVVLICFSVALMVFVNVMRTEKAWDQLKAGLLLKEISLITKQEKSYTNNEYDKGIFIIEKLVSEYDSDPSLGLLEIKVYKNSYLMIESKEIFIRYEDFE